MFDYICLSIGFVVVVGFIVQITTITTTAKVKWMETPRLNDNYYNMKMELVAFVLILSRMSRVHVRTDAFVLFICKTMCRFLFRFVNLRFCFMWLLHLSLCVLYWQIMNIFFCLRLFNVRWIVYIEWDRW